jgi:hypothetical protein
MNNLAQTNTAKSLKYFDPGQIKLVEQEDDYLRATLEGGEVILDPRFILANPLTDPHGYLSVTNALGEEVGLIRNWKQLEPASQQLVEKYLNRHYLPIIVKHILSVKSLYGLVVCEFDTNRGIRKATLRDFKDSIVYIGETRMIFNDMDGNRYDLPDLPGLDGKSQLHLAKMMM